MPTIIHVTDRALVINHKIIVLLEVIRESRDRMYDPPFRDRWLVRPTDQSRHQSSVTERLRGAQDVRGERSQDLQQPDSSSRWDGGCYSEHFRSRL